MRSDRGDAADREFHEAAGAVFGLVRGVERARHYGDPEAEYRAATEGVAVADRSFRARLAVHGRAPARMLDGIITASVPGGPSQIGPGVGAGRAAYAAVLTPRGRMVTDLRVVRLDPGGGDDRLGSS
ncbi:MAG TPA: hypothetical protein VE173_11190, partial [Longimicrobiales bacterium]|nr:hypothetical protein [Longimicrobiales bacterium]